MKTKATTFSFFPISTVIITLLITSRSSGETLFTDQLKIGIHERFLCRGKQLDSSWKGVDVDLMGAISKEAGFTFQLIGFPWKRTLKKLETVEVNLTLSASITPEREKYALFLKSTYRVGHNVMFIKIADKHRIAFFYSVGERNTHSTTVHPLTIWCTWGMLNPVLTSIENY